MQKQENSRKLGPGKPLAGLPACTAGLGFRRKRPSGLETGMAELNASY